MSVLQCLASMTHPKVETKSMTSRELPPQKPVDWRQYKYFKELCLHYYCESGGEVCDSLIFVSTIYPKAESSKSSPHPKTQLHHLSLFRPKPPHNLAQILCRRRQQNPLHPLSTQHEEQGERGCRGFVFLPAQHEEQDGCVLLYRLIS